MRSENIERLDGSASKPPLSGLPSQPLRAESAEGLHGARLPSHFLVSSSGACCEVKQHQRCECQVEKVETRVWRFVRGNNRIVQTEGVMQTGVERHRVVSRSQAQCVRALSPGAGRAECPRRAFTSRTSWTYLNRPLGYQSPTRDRRRLCFSRRRASGITPAWPVSSTRS